MMSRGPTNPIEPESSDAPGKNHAAPKQSKLQPKP